jgi:hypothetical protein
VRCRIELTVQSDRPYWIKWDAFLRLSHDLACRKSHEIESFYCDHWFSSAAGACFFKPPAFYLDGGAAYFINGRHRAILLSRFLPLVPMSLTGIDQASKPLLDAIVSRPIDLHEDFELPDLPIRDDLPEH